MLSASKINIKEIDTAVRDAVLLAHNRAIRTSKYGEKVGEWHISSMILHKGKGWKSIAKNVAMESKQSRSETQMNSLARDIENHVKAYRKIMCIKID